ncbi:alpha/beta fold hydrolase [Sphaerotilus mobilis]|uniref:Sigma-B regulation protein RsbQ n=1 Tax=Sphaerotilus mobilis TaxID=47994 RepID=A0A4Q7LDR2_9BURK|nr:alpha/beta hydrolase [Sphaerotilus mobilis]RZS52071.1 sigma-B regulation protein RsbQ [Sphaerotilus mobilis]
MLRELNVHILPAEGSGPAQTVLLAHGYGCDQSLWREVAQALPQARRVLFDWPGAGGSDPDAYDAGRHASLDGYADDLLALMAALDLHDAVVVGHSVAGTIAAIAAAREPGRFGQLVMVAPSPCFINDPPGYEGGFDRPQLEALIDALADGQAAWSRAVAPVVMGNPDRPELSDQLADSFCAMDPAIALRWARATFLTDIRALVPRVNVPCLVLQCQSDALAPMAVGDWLAAHLPVSRQVSLQATGHCPHVSAPAEVAHVLSHWMGWRG